MPPESKVTDASHATAELKLVGAKEHVPVSRSCLTDLRAHLGPAKTDA